MSAFSGRADQGQGSLNVCSCPRAEIEAKIRGPALVPAAGLLRFGRNCSWAHPMLPTFVAHYSGKVPKI